MLVTGLFIITFILQAFEIPSSSMEKTLLIGDHVFVNRHTQFAPRTGWVGPLLPYRQIRRGDIVVFFSVSEPGLYIVKRIMGIPETASTFATALSIVTGKNWMSHTWSTAPEKVSILIVTTSRQCHLRNTTMLQPIGN